MVNLNWFKNNFLSRIKKSKLLHHNNLGLCTLSFGIIFFSATNAFSVNTPNYDRCSSKESGEWNFGRAPEICLAQTFGEDSYLLKQFPRLIFNDLANSKNTERNRYVSELTASLKDGAASYITKRNPKVSTDEKNAWITLVTSTAAHESYLSHYRRSQDKKIKMMRGDLGHGHGLMQLDDRAHFNAVEKGIAWNLAKNFIYGMDILYTQWLRSQTAKCIRNTTYWKDRIRSAWSAYNGGSGKICRWSNNQDPWAKNDKNFLSILDNRPWLSYVTQPQLVSSINFSCFLKGLDDCASGNTIKSPSDQNAAIGTPPSLNENGSGPNDEIESGPEKTEIPIYKINDFFCISKGNSLDCIDQEKDKFCLTEGRQLLVSREVPPNLKKLPLNSIDRHTQCPLNDKSLFMIGDGLETLKNIHLRSTAEGGIITVVPSGSLLQVLDFEYTGPNKERSYKVSFLGRVGFIYAGNPETQSQWILPNNLLKIASQIIGRKNEYIQIKNPAGINLRNTPAGSLMQNIPNGVRLKILDVEVKTTENKIYYKVNYKDTYGFIYSGSINPSIDLNEWTRNEGFKDQR